MVDEEEEMCRRSAQSVKEKKRGQGIYMDKQVPSVVREAASCLSAAYFDLLKRELFIVAIVLFFRFLEHRPSTEAYVGWLRCDRLQVRRLQ